MPLFRHQLTDQKYSVEYTWSQGTNYYQSPIKVYITEKSQKDGKDEYKVVETLGEIKYEKNQAKAGYNFKSTTLGEITIKFVRKFLIIEKIEVSVAGKEIKGHEVLDLYMYGSKIGTVN